MAKDCWQKDAEMEEYRKGKGQGKGYGKGPYGGYGKGAWEPMEPRAMEKVMEKRACIGLISQQSQAATMTKRGLLL